VLESLREHQLGIMFTPNFYLFTSDFDHRFTLHTPTFVLKSAVVLAVYALEWSKLDNGLNSRVTIELVIQVSFPPKLAAAAALDLLMK
jgi:hypothetical protein